MGPPPAARPPRNAALIEASCRRGALRFTVETAPREVDACNRSICRRYGPARGDRDLGFHRCRVCGCVTHWAAADHAVPRMGVTARLTPSEVLATAGLTYGDGASI